MKKKRSEYHERTGEQKLEWIQDRFRIVDKYNEDIKKQKSSLFNYGVAELVAAHTFYKSLNLLRN